MPAGGTAVQLEPRLKLDAWLEGMVGVYLLLWERASWRHFWILGLYEEAVEPSALRLFREFKQLRE